MWSWKRNSSTHFLLQCSSFQKALRKLKDTLNKISDLSGCKKTYSYLRLFCWHYSVTMLPRRGQADKGSSFSVHNWYKSPDLILLLSHLQSLFYASIPIVTELSSTLKFSTSEVITVDYICCLLIVFLKRQVSTSLEIGQSAINRIWTRRFIKLYMLFHV